jgi:hypothetical protein
MRAVANIEMQIKCIMDNSGPPCKRCTERNLSCVLNKSLQTLLEERSQYVNPHLFRHWGHNQIGLHTEQ